MRNTRKLLGMTAIGLTLALTAACGDAAGGSSGGDGSAGDGGSDGSGGGADTIEVNFGFIPDYNGTSLLAIAEDQGLWEEHGIDVTTTSFTNGPLQIQALGTGDLDFGYIGPGAFWLPASGQAEIVAMNTLGQADRVVAQAGYESMEDLHGQTVAVPEGTSGDMILTLALEDAGMSREDIEIVPMEPSAIVAAFSSGQVEAAGFWYPSLSTVKEQVPDMVELAQNSDFEDTVSFPTAFVSGTDLVENETEKVERVLAVLREAIAYRYENQDETIQLTAEFNNLDVADVEGDAANVQLLSLEEIDTYTEDGTVNTWLSGMVDYFVQAGKLDEPADPNDFYTGNLFLGAGE